MNEERMTSIKPSKKSYKPNTPPFDTKEDAERFKEATDAACPHDDLWTRDYESETAQLPISVSDQTVQRSFADAGSQFSGPAAIHPESVHATLNFEPLRVIEIQANGKYADLHMYIKAVEAIEAKASSLGYGSQDLIGDVINVPGGYLGRYAGHDIYTANGKETFEVHGEIRAKYNALGGASGLLGMPKTDEQGAPDGIGRYNHFTTGSIYWTPRTGPMAVRGTVRDRWASTGWERGPFGYPVQDQHRMIPIPPTDPIVEWCRFENGVIAGDPKGGKDAPAAVLSYAELGRLVGAQISEQFIASPDNVALRPGNELTGTTDWRYDFWSSVSRAVGFRFRGFHDNGLVVPDTNFIINIGLRFELTWWPSFTEPVNKTLIAVLDFLRVIHESGPPYIGGKVISGVSTAIAKSFYPSVWPDPEHPEVPRGAIYIADVPTGADIGTWAKPGTGVINILDVLISATGDLQVLVNPLSPPKQAPGFTFDYGHERQRQMQDRLDSM